MVFMAVLLYLDKFHQVVWHINYVPVSKQGYYGWIFLFIQWSLAMRKDSERSDFDKSFKHIITLHCSIMKPKFHPEMSEADTGGAL